MLYKTEENNHPGWFNKSHWYNTAIYSKFYGKVLEAFLNSRTDRYNIMCSIIAHDKQEPSYVDDEKSGGSTPIPKN